MRVDSHYPGWRGVGPGNRAFDSSAWVRAFASWVADRAGDPMACCVLCGDFLEKGCLFVHCNACTSFVKGVPFDTFDFMVTRCRLALWFTENQGDI